MSKNMYKGNRYVPIIKGVWNNKVTYEPLSIVTWGGLSYTSKTNVPVGASLSNEKYWVVTGNYNQQVENYRQDVYRLRKETEKSICDINLKLSAIDSGQLINPMNYGAIGNGVTDDTKAFKDAIEIAVIQGKGLLVPNGTFLIDGIDLPHEFLIIGYGKKSKLKASNKCETLINIPFESKRCIVQDLYLQCDRKSNGVTTNTTAGTKIPSRHIFNNLHIYAPLIGMHLRDIGNFSTNIDIEGGSTLQNTVGLLVETSCTDNYFSNIKSYQNDIGFKIIGSSNFFTNCKTLVNNWGLVVGESSKSCWNFICTNFSSQENYQQNIVINRMRNSTIQGVSEGAGVNANGVDVNSKPISAIQLINCLYSNITIQNKVQSPQGSEVYGVYIEENAKQNNINFTYFAEKTINGYKPIFSLYPNINTITVNSNDYNNGYYEVFDNTLEPELIDFNKSYTTMEIVYPNILKLHINVKEGKANGRNQFGFSILSSNYHIGGINFVIQDLKRNLGVKIGCQGQVVADKTLTNVIEWYDTQYFDKYVHGTRVIPAGSVTNPTSSRFNFIVNVENYYEDELDITILDVKHAFYNK